MTTHETRSQSSQIFRVGCWLFAVMTLVLLGILSWRWLTDASDRTAAAVAVQLLLNQQQDAWNIGDLDGFMTGYRMTDDITFYSEGRIEQGWVSLRERYEKKYRVGGQSMGTLTFSNVEMDVLATDAVLAKGRWQVEWPHRSASGLFTILVRRFPEGWRIVHDHTSAAS